MSKDVWAVKPGRRLYVAMKEELSLSLRYLTAGETHGPQLTAIIEGLPSNLTLDFEELNFQLHRRQKGHGPAAGCRLRRIQLILSEACVMAERQVRL